MVAGFGCVGGFGACAAGWGAGSIHWGCGVCLRVFAGCETGFLFGDRQGFLAGVGMDCVSGASFYCTFRVFGVR